MAGNFKSDFLEGEEFRTAFGWLVVNMVHNIVPKSTPSGAVSVPPLSSMAVVLKALTPLRWKSDRINAEVRNHRQLHTIC